MKTTSKTYQKVILLMLCSSFMLASIVADAQQSKKSAHQELRNEFKVNFLGLAIGLPELSYERLIHENMGVGISAAAGIQNDEYKFMIIPHYRYYLGKKYANGFFFEANTAIFSDDAVQADDGGIRKDKTYYGLGGGVGLKQVFGKGIVAELILGLGSKLNNKPVKDGATDVGLYKRLGITIGKRF